MTKDPIKCSIRRYLDEVALYLDLVPLDQRTQVLKDLEAHIYDALNERASVTPVLDDVKAVIASMPAPSSFSPGSEPPEETRWTSPTGKLPLETWIGFALILLAVALQLVHSRSGLFILTYLVLAAGLLSSFFGMLALIHLRTAGGRLTGRRFTFAVALCCPLLIVNAFIYYLFLAASYIIAEAIVVRAPIPVGGGASYNDGPILMLAGKILFFIGLPLLLVTNTLFIRKVWGMVRRALPVSR